MRIGPQQCQPWLATVLLVLPFALGGGGDEAKSFREPGGIIQIDADFPGGNIIVDGFDGHVVHLRQDVRDTAGGWFYWYFRVRGAAGRKLTFRFSRGSVIAANGPAVSSDGGSTWQWLGREAGNQFSYAFADNAEEVRFCLAFPYLEQNLHAWLKRHADNPHLKLATLATSKKGRRVERLHVGKLEGEPQHRVLLTARHHACEMMASWTLEGILEEALAPSDDGRWLRSHVELLAIPFMDKDGVEDGDQGKNRKPHDHNRDYLGESIYREVAALREFVPKWSQGKLRIALDLHCPSLGDRQLVLVGSRYPEIWERQQQFAAILQQSQIGPLVYDPKHNVPYGTAWNKLPEPRNCASWTGALPGMLVAGTFEIPYAEAGGKPVTAQSARAFGRDIARAIRRYLESCPPAPTDVSLRQG
jgi:hypothetical protein